MSSLFNSAADYLSTMANLPGAAERAAEQRAIFASRLTMTGEEWKAGKEEREAKLKSLRDQGKQAKADYIQSQKPGPTKIARENSLPYGKTEFNELRASIQAGDADADDKRAYALMKFQRSKASGQDTRGVNSDEEFLAKYDKIQERKAKRGRKGTGGGRRSGTDVDQFSGVNNSINDSFDTEITDSYNTQFDQQNNTTNTNTTSIGNDNVIHGSVGNQTNSTLNTQSLGDFRSQAKERSQNYLLNLMG